MSTTAAGDIKIEIPPDPTWLPGDDRDDETTPAHDPAEWHLEVARLLCQATRNHLGRCAHCGRTVTRQSGKETHRIYACHSLLCGPCSRRIAREHDRADRDTVVLAALRTRRALFCRTFIVEAAAFAAAPIDEIEKAENLVKELVGRPGMIGRISESGPVLGRPAWRYCVLEVDSVGVQIVGSKTDKLDRVVGLQPRDEAAFPAMWQRRCAEHGWAGSYNVEVVQPCDMTRSGNLEIPVCGRGGRSEEDVERDAKALLTRLHAPLIYVIDREWNAGRLTDVQAALEMTRLQVGRATRDPTGKIRWKRYRTCRPLGVLAHQVTRAMELLDVIPSVETGFCDPVVAERTFDVVDRLGQATIELRNSVGRSPESRLVERLRVRYHGPHPRQERVIEIDADGDGPTCTLSSRYGLRALREQFIVAMSRVAQRAGRTGSQWVHVPPPEVAS